MGIKHSVLLKEDKCEGCTNCVKNCPTKAIRVHQGKATIKEELCIDCAECIRTCAYHAKYARTDELEDIKDYSYPVALVPPSFYGQFHEDIKPVHVVKGLKQLGFKEVFDVSLAAEAVSKKTAEFLKENEGFYISSSCPVVVRLIKLLYPELLEYLMPIKSPVELMAGRIKNEYINKLKVDIDKLGVFLLTPCPAKATTAVSPLGMEKSFLDRAIAVEKIYQPLISSIEKVKKTDNPDQMIGATPYLGIGWGQTGGEEKILKQNQQKVLSVSGIHNVKALLEEISRNNIKGIKYFELTACSQGCVGGVLNVINPFQARYNLKRLFREADSFTEQDYSFYDYDLSRDFKAIEVGKLDDNLEKAMDKLARLESELEILPGLDCAACGAPDCETLAEDIVNGMAERSDCIFVLRKQVGDLADRMSQLAHALPPVMRGKYRTDKKVKIDGDKKAALDIDKNADDDKNADEKLAGEEK